MYVIETEKNKFFSGGSERTNKKEEAALFESQKEAEKYAKDLDGSKVVKKKR